MFIKRFTFLFAILIGLCNFNFAKAANHELTFQDRVEYQRAIERVYWQHRIWPKENPGPKPSLEKILPDSAIISKVEDYLRKSNALEQYWQRPITAKDLQSEMDRMVAHTRNPSMLKQLFAVLNNDPYVIAECLARPLLAVKLIHESFRNDQQLHMKRSFDEWWNEIRFSMRSEILSPSFLYDLSVPSTSCVFDTWDPAAISTVNAPSARIYHAAFWTGSEMVIWGGTDNDSFENTGGLYDPSTDSWSSMTTVDAPTERYGESAVWTGTEMIIWGGMDAGGLTNTGGRYDVSSDTWRPGGTTTVDAPLGRVSHTAVWTGTDMIVWGGSVFGPPELNSGARYDAGNDIWIGIYTPSYVEGRTGHSAVWTGSEMVIWGGINQHTDTGFLDTGWRYDPNIESWSPMSYGPSARCCHSAVWTGQEMIVWGGSGMIDETTIGALNTGGVYNPQYDQWIETATVNPPSPRTAHTAIWNGTEMIIWGGYDYSSVLNTGGRYNPSTYTWAGTTMTDAPSERQFHSAVWTEKEMIIWGGSSDMLLNTGGRYCAKLNNAPIAIDYWYSADKNLELNIPAPGVLQWDSDEDGDQLTAVLETNPSYGTLNFNSDGSFIYQPNFGFTGNDSFTYHANDGYLDSNIATVFINVINSSPWAIDDYYGIFANEILNVAAPGVLSNDFDKNGDTLSVLWVIQEPLHGVLNMDWDGSFTYQPEEGFVGVDSFKYYIDDGSPEWCESYFCEADVFITVSSDLPSAVEDNYQTAKNVVLNVPSPGVLANDSDPNGDPLTAILDVGPTSGTLTLNSDGSFTYTPQTNYVGADSFTYHANDGSNNSNIATVTITVTNDAPSAADDNYQTGKNVTLDVAAPGVLGNDSDPNDDPLTAIVDVGPSNGTLTLSSDGSFSYTPNTDYAGADSFTYHANDGNDNSNIAMVAITVTNDAPIAADDAYQTNKNVALNVAAPGVLGNDSDPTSDQLTAVVDVNPTKGTLTLNSDGSFTYTPNTDYVGADSFTYHANDGANDSNIATVNLTVNETCLYCDDFNDGNPDPNWTYIKQFWSESNGSLIGTPTGRMAIAIASPIYPGCQTCNIETKMRSAGGAFNKVWMLGWYVDKKNTMELLMKEESDRWILKQRVNGSLVAKAKGIKIINPNTDYAVRITFDGNSFNVFVDDFVTPLFTLTPLANVPVGTVGFKVKNTIGSFDYVSVN